MVSGGILNINKLYVDKGGEVNHPKNIKEVAVVKIDLLSMVNLWYIDMDIWM